MLDDLRRLRRFEVVHSLRHDLGGDVVAPGLVFRRLGIFLGEGRHERLAAGRFDQMMPDHRPGADEVALACGPGQRGVEPEPADREGEAELGILLEEVGDLVAGEIDHHEIGLGLADLEQISGEVGGVGRHQIVTGEIAAIGFHEALADFQEVMAERIVGRLRIPLLALDQTIAQERAADGFDIHRILRLDVEHVALAILAAQRVGIAAGIDEQRLVARGDLRDGQARGGRNLADDAGDLVALDHAFGLGRCGLRVDRVFLEQFDLAAHHAARRVDLFHREVDRHHGIFAERPEKAGARRQMTDSDDVGGLRAQNGRRGHSRHQRNAAGRLQQAAARELIMV